MTVCSFFVVNRHDVEFQCDAQCHPRFNMCIEHLQMMPEEDQIRCGFCKTESQVTGESGSDSLSETAESPARVQCNWVFNRGEKKGQRCDKKCNGGFCFVHKKANGLKESKEPKEKKSEGTSSSQRNQCEFIFTRNPRKGERCPTICRGGAKLCGKHKGTSNVNAPS